MAQQPADGQRHWTEDDMPDLSGCTALVTGANAGLGLQTARVLAARGAHVILGCRNPDKACHAAAEIAGVDAEANTSVVRLDLASQSSVRAAAGQIRARFPRLDLIINNAGVMEVPWTALSTSLICSPTGITTRSRRIRSSKLANLLFTYELDRRLRVAGSTVIALACHPGVVCTGLFATRSRLQQFLLSPAMRILNFWAVQNVRMGALPTLRAATDPAAQGGEYFGPRRYGLRRRFYTGYPAIVQSSARSHDQANQARLWHVSEQLTGVNYAALV